MSAPPDNISAPTLSPPLDVISSISKSRSFANPFPSATYIGTKNCERTTSATLTRNGAACAFATNIVAGDTVTVVCGFFGGSISSVLGNSGAETFTAGPALSFQNMAYYVLSSVGGYTNIVITTSVSAVMDCVVNEFKDTGGTPTYDSSLAFRPTGAGTAATNCTTMTPTVSGELFIAEASVNNGPTLTFNWLGGGTTPVNQTTTSGAYAAIGAGYAINTASGSQIPNWTWTGNQSWGCLQMAFKP